MLELLLFRHAKSRRDQPAIGDHDRDLAPRGERTAPRMGRLLRQRGWVPDLVLCSTARRAARTWDLAAAELPATPRVERLGSLYLAAPAGLLDIIRRQDARFGRLMVVGHNPGLETLACRLVADAAAIEHSGLSEKFPTAAIVRIGFAAATWSEVEPGAGRLLDFVRPRELD